MEERKVKEIEYYDKKAEAFSGVGDFEGFKPQPLSSYQILYKLLRRYCSGKVVLDYGCGNGIHSVFLAKAGAERVVGIDLSGKSLALARQLAIKEGVEKKIEFLAMDCERMDFPENSFDLILDGGTFSSLDLERAFGELSRVLRPGGVLVGIETFGHNPLTNLRRRLRRKRTDWATQHILREKDFLLAQKYFSKIRVYYFHLISWLAFPFLRLPGGKILLRILEITDRILLRVPFLKRYAFKVVFTFRK